MTAKPHYKIYQVVAEVIDTETYEKRDIKMQLSFNRRLSLDKIKDYLKEAVDYYSLE